MPLLIISRHLLGEELSRSHDAASHHTAALCIHYLRLFSLHRIWVITVIVYNIIFDLSSCFRKLFYTRSK